MPRFIKKLIIFIRSHMLTQIILLTLPGAIFGAVLYRSGLLLWFLIVQYLTLAILAATFVRWVSDLKKLHQNTILTGYHHAGPSFSIKRRDEIGQMSDTLERIRLKSLSKQEQESQARQKRDLTLACLTHDIQNVLANASTNLHCQRERASAPICHSGLDPESISASISAPISAPASPEHGINYGKFAACNIRRAQTWLRLISDYTTAEAGFFPNPHTVELSVLLKQILDEHQVMSLKAQMPLRWIPPSECFRTRVDSYCFTRIMENLLNNAFQHGTHGSPVTVTAAPLSDGLSVTVKNHSPEISESVLTHLFDPFFTAAAKSSDTSPIRLNHSGLGLFIAKKLAESAQGDLSVTKDEDGICFRLYLPSLCQPDPAPDRNPGPDSGAR
ncbi:MAG: sensor histidine kinase [Peptococcaceae bacterium]|jgi:signal transduction histidine kinase|nr:sensor histidine kinase [Peptococcaceae bacterium]